MLSDYNFPEYNQRCLGHDYNGSFIYHIILKKAPGYPAFGKVAGNALIPFGHYGCAHICRSEIGKAVFKGLKQWNESVDCIDLWKYSIMPDHIHLIINKNRYTKEHLSHFITILKQLVRDSINQISQNNYECDDIFQSSYCDKPLFINRSLDGWFRYVEQNPHRLAMQIQHPEFFQRIKNIEISGNTLEAYGNLFFLCNPDKYAVKISRSFSPRDEENLRRLWISESIKGSILVSPFISPAEKEIFQLANSIGGKFILIQHEIFAPKYKPPGKLFELCEKGRLLIISLGLPPKTPLSRETCLRMNSLATAICSTVFFHA